MTEAHIYIYGIISPFQNSMAGDYGEVNLKQVVSQIQAGKDADVFKVHIRSEGGDVNEGFAIHDALVNSGKQIDTIGEGIVASIATVVFLSGKNRIMSQNAEFLIHNPWNWGAGTADDMQKNADELRSIENKLVSFYNQKTGLDEQTIKDLMKNESYISAEQSKNYGFATEIMQTFKAVALFNNSNIITMTKDEVNQEVDKKLGKLTQFFNKLESLFSPVKNLKVTAGDGSVLDFGDQVQEEKEIAVGMTATLDDGKQPAGEYVMPDGSTITFEAGKVTAITPKVEDKTEALQKENDALKQEIEGMKAQNLLDKEALTKATASIEDMKKEFTEIKAQVKSDVETFLKTQKTDGDPPEVRKVNKQLI